jgi:hypothetical protein
MVKNNPTTLKADVLLAACQQRQNYSYKRKRERQTDDTKNLIK